uniref:GTP binding protein 3, mitochondrial n=1 Tax=Pipistrellus kuhlii TaxID=59472 RepID=A0A7J7S4I7_PIPKU|nr:GTP binding protein 3, mitochondrial [Pipistrellus kuhlii]
MWRGLWTLAARATVRAPEQRCRGSRVRGHHFRSELRPRPLWHRGDPDQRSCQRARPPELDCAPGAAARPQRQPAPAHRPALRGAAGPRLGALVPRSPQFHG